MAKNHAPEFLKLVDSVRPQIKECTVADVVARRAAAENFHLVDVREESEFAASHIPDAVHIGKGVIERDIEQKIPDSTAPIVLYCGGGYRSALAALSRDEAFSNVGSHRPGCPIRRFPDRLPSSRETRHPC